MKKLIGILLLALGAAGCHAQIPPASNYAVTLTWTAPQATSSWAGCTSAAPCSYAVFRAAATGTTCPASSSTAWSEITTGTTRPSADAYSDPAAQGLDVCYAVETVQGGANSGPSNTYNVTVPATPGSPGVLSGATRAAMAPQLEKLTPLPAAKTLAMGAPMELRAR